MCLYIASTFTALFYVVSRVFFTLEVFISRKAQIFINGIEKEGHEHSKRWNFLDMYTE